jgi:hypothetical protein
VWGFTSIQNHDIAHTAIGLATLRKQTANQFNSNMNTTHAKPTSISPAGMEPLSESLSLELLLLLLLSDDEDDDDDEDESEDDESDEDE